MTPELQPSKPDDQWANRIVAHEMVAPDQLLANPFNFRRHTRFQQAVMVEVLEVIGWIDEVTVNIHTGHMVNGHMRVILALRYDEPLIPVRFVDLSPAEEALALLAYDEITDQAIIDHSLMNTLLDTLRADTPHLLQMTEMLRRDLSEPEADETEGGEKAISIRFALPQDQYARWSRYSASVGDDLPAIRALMEAALAQP